MSDTRSLRIAKAKRKQAAWKAQRAWKHKYNTVPSFRNKVGRSYETQRQVALRRPLTNAINKHFRLKLAKQKQAAFRKQYAYKLAQAKQLRKRQKTFNKQELLAQWARDRSFLYEQGRRLPRDDMSDGAMELAYKRAYGNN